MSKTADDELWKKLDARYRRLRLKRGMLPEDAVRFGLTVKFYQQLETGKPHRLTTLYKLSRMFNVKMSDLLKNILQ